MGKIVYEMSMSLDGLIAGAGVSLEQCLGAGGEHLHEWGSPTRPTKPRPVEKGGKRLGAMITG